MNRTCQQQSKQQSINKPRPQIIHLQLILRLRWRADQHIMLRHCLPITEVRYTFQDSNFFTYFKVNTLQDVYPCRSELMFGRYNRPNDELCKWRSMFKDALVQNKQRLFFNATDFRSLLTKSRFCRNSRILTVSFIYVWRWDVWQSKHTKFEG